MLGLQEDLIHPKKQEMKQGLYRRFNISWKCICVGKCHPVDKSTLRKFSLQRSLWFLKSGMCGAELFPAGRGGARKKIRGAGEGENLRGGAKECVNRLIQKFNKSAYIVMEIFVVYYDALINEMKSPLIFKRYFCEAGSQNM